MRTVHGVLGVGAMLVALLASTSAKAADCSVQPTDGNACREAIAGYDSWCDVNGQWDSLCVNECSSEPACTGAAAGSCGAAEDISMGGIFTGNTSSYPSGLVPTASDDCSSTEGTGREAVHKMKFATKKIVTLSTEGSGFDTLLHVRRGSDTDCNGTQVACKDDGLPGYTSSLTFTAEAGQTYYVIVDGWSSTSAGAYKLRADVVDPTPPSNDTQAGATAVQVTGNVASVTGTTADAASNYTASCGSSAGSNDRVYQFTLGATKTVTIDTNGSGYDTVVHVRNSSFGEVACDDDSGDGTNSRLSLSLAAGTYYVVVDGYGASASGSYKMNISGTDSPPILFVNGHGKHNSTAAVEKYWGGTGSSAFPKYVAARTSKSVVVHGYDHTIGLVSSANALAADINSTFPTAGDGTVSIVAHSAGGLVSRYILSHADDGTTGQRYLAAKKIRKVISNQSPQNGTILADIVKEGGFTNWVGGLMGFDTPMVDDMRTFVQSNHGNCTGVTGGCAKIFTIGADGGDGGWVNDISKFLGIPVPGTGHVEDWGLMATGAIGRSRQSAFDDSDGFISKASATHVGTNINLTNANHFHGTHCTYRTDLCDAAVTELNK